jgi:Holliday junction resolvase RusA-like endonuclease
MPALTFVIYGVAQPKGSARAFLPKGSRFPVVTSDNPKVKGWQQLVAEGASRALSGAGCLLDGPVALAVRFYLPRPKSLKGSRPHTTRPDCSKLIRSTEDALTGVVFRDDGQVVQLHVEKEYAGVGESPRAVVIVTPLEGMIGGSAPAIPEAPA